MTSDYPLELFKTLKTLPGKEKMFVADGDKVVRRAIIAKLDILKILTHEKAYLDRLADLVDRENVCIIEKEKMHEITGYNHHQGVMALIKTPEMKELNELSPPFLILNNVSQVENIGVMMRTAAAFGYKSIILDQGSCHPYTRRAVRVSMGCVFNLNIHMTTNLKETIQRLKTNNIEVLGTSLDSKALCLNDFSFNKNQNFALIFGSEGYGLDQEVSDLCHTLLKIEMKNGVDSLNISTATSIFLYQSQK